MILNRMKSGNKRLIEKRRYTREAGYQKASMFLITIGAGDIDTLVKPIEDKLKKERAK